MSEGDILFIDSSHMVRINGDVNYLYLEVLPRLAKGVVVHIHDICFPYPTPPPDDWVFTRHQFWTEAALVQAFLIFNSAFKVLLCSSYLHYKAPDVLYSVFSFPMYDILKGKTTSTYVRIDALLDNVSVVANGKGGGYLPQAFTFSADGKSTTLTFKDVSTVTQNVDLLLETWS